ncbi:head-tail connector protein [Bacillus sp. FJAT-49732]|uniref:Head-tail connector protein n=1 Tax=Lederbergia citrisecunda TaxID=2833583 RepID=A0A942TK62_9BACI|nr:head-tail connector protein [Lederbergia citrisecunda]MBS4198613.1 head-tail connector protein [Lederbergia citrisecunda]
MKDDLLTLCKRQLRFEIDESDQDEDLNFLIESTKEELIKSGVEDDESKMYKRLVVLMVQKAYEGEETPKNLDKSIQALILKLKSW